MITDSFFEQGVTHEVCEDYSLSGPNYAILSDGCSNGGGARIDSDWGARILCKSAEQHLKELKNSHNQFLSAVGATAKTQCASFPNLPIECLTATLLLLSQKDETNFHGLVVGDGTIGGQRHDGTWKIVNYDFVKGGTSNNSAPFYLKYLINDEVGRYLELFGGKVKKTEYNGLFSGEMEVQEEIIDFNESKPYQNHEFSKDEFKFLFVASDGLSSFYQQIKTETSKHTEAVGFLDIVKVMFDVSDYRPGFLRIQRQWTFKRATKGTFKQRNWFNGDDVSIAGIYTN
jgi:hypothetical protein